MANVKPYLTSDSMVESIKKRISFPTSQNTFSYTDILDFVNEEMMISTVPSIMQAHQEYLVYKKIIPLVQTISRYPIPSRAIGMSLRDLVYSDTNGNYYDMGRIAPDDKAFFQNSMTSSLVAGRYYVEGNEIVLTPQNVTSATGNLNMFFFLRPNQLVRNNRAAIIESYQKIIQIIDNTLIAAGDTITITINVQTPSPTIYTLTAISGGSPSSTEFLIGATASLTASNIVNTIVGLGNDELSATLGTSELDVTYYDIAATFLASNTSAFSIDSTTLTIQFDQLPTSYTDIDTNETSSLFTVGTLVDFLQTNPGHRTYTYDIPLLANSNNRGTFYARDFQTYQGNSSGGYLTYYNIQIGDYICVQNECIIPQIPPELHSALAERGAGRILMSIGDREGYAASLGKVEQMNKAQDTLIDNRVESQVPKVFNRNSLLRLGKARLWSRV